VPGDDGVPLEEIAAGVVAGLVETDQAAQPGIVVWKARHVASRHAKSRGRAAGALIVGKLLGLPCTPLRRVLEAVSELLTVIADVADLRHRTRSHRECAFPAAQAALRCRLATGTTSTGFVAVCTSR